MYTTYSTLRQEWLLHIHRQLKGWHSSNVHTKLRLALFMDRSETISQTTKAEPHISKYYDRDLHASLSSTADKWLRFLHFFAPQNSILKRILSFSFHFNATHLHRQIQCKEYKNWNSVSNHSFAAVLPGDSVAGIVVANGILNFLGIYNTLLIVRLVLTWFPNSPPAIVSPLSTLCDPYLNIFRGIIPPLGGTLVLSPILAFLVLNAFTSTAAALPAELP